MKKILLATALIAGFVGTASATGVGPYVGVQGGYSWMNLGNKSSHDNGLSGDIHAGYLLPLTSSLSLGPEVGLGTNFYSPKESGWKLDTNYYVPVMAKLQWQVSNELYLFGKAGITYVSQTQKHSGLSYDNSVWHASFGLGAGYNLSQNLALEASYNYVDGDDEDNSNTIKNNTSRFQNVSVGVNYSF